MVNLDNSGTIVIHQQGRVAGLAHGIHDPGGSGQRTSFTNSGEFFVISDHYHASFLLTWQSDRLVTNSGLIALYSPEGNSTAIHFANGGRVVNAAGGRILVEGLNASGIVMPIGTTPREGGNPVDVTNAGHIEVRSYGDYPSIAIYVGVGEVDNSETIIGDIAVFLDGKLTNSGTIIGAVYSEEFIRVQNRGTIHGDLFGGEGTELSDEISNPGLVMGDVILFAGDDVFSNVGGYVAGYVELGSGADQFSGSAKGDEVYGGPGDDTLRANGGDDYLEGEEGNDLLDSGAGADLLIGGPGTDTLVGGAGNDILDGGQEADALDGGEGDDYIIYDAADDMRYVTGGAGNDVLAIEGAVPAGVDLISQGFEAAEVTQRGQGGNVASMVGIYNGNWQVVEASTNYLDGSKVTVSADPTGAYDTRQVWYAYDTAGRLSYVDNLYDDGTRLFVNLDEDSSKAWRQDWFSYDAQGRLDSEDVLYDGGSRTFVNFDQAGAFGWSQDWFNYDALGRLDSEDLVRDDGSHTFIDLDQDGSKSWSSAWFSYDAQGRLDTQDVINYDQAGSETFKLTAMLYDPSGKLIQQVIVWDNGSTSYMYF